MCRLLLFRRYALLPEQFALDAAEASDCPAVTHCLRDEYPVAPDDRRRIAGFGQGNPPLDVHVRAPFYRQFFFLGDAGAKRSAPRWPIRGIARGSKKQKQEEGTHELC